MKTSVEDLHATFKSLERLSVNSKALAGPPQFKFVKSLGQLNIPVLALTLTRFAKKRIIKSIK